MKTLAFVMCCLPFVLLAQSRSIDRFCHAYSDTEAFSHVNLQGQLVGSLLSANGANEDLEGIFGIRILSTNEQGAHISRRDINQLYRDLAREGFEEMLYVQEADKEITFFTLQQGGKISELTLLVDGAGEFALLSLYGEIDPCKLGEACKQLSINGQHYLQQLPDCEAE